MNHAVEYFHSLVEHEFTRDQYEVSFNEGKYHVTITIPDNGHNPMSYYICMIYQKKMERCVEGLIKSNNLKLSAVLPIRLVRENLKEHHEKLNRLLRDTTSTNYQ
jgi:hypothetical protein